MCVCVRWCVYWCVCVCVCMNVCVVQRTFHIEECLLLGKTINSNQTLFNVTVLFRAEDVTSLAAPLLWLLQVHMRLCE